jgi:predicted transcriptional regulator
MTTLKDLKAELLVNPLVKAEYDALEEEFALINALLDARARSGLTQDEIARRMGTTQSAVARLESGRSKPSMRTLERYAAATGSKVRVVLEAAE